MPNLASILTPHYFQYRSYPNNHSNFSPSSLQTCSQLSSCLPHYHPIHTRILVLACYQIISQSIFIRPLLLTLIHMYTHPNSHSHLWGMRCRGGTRWGSMNRRAKVAWAPWWERWKSCSCRWLWSPIVTTAGAFKGHWLVMMRMWDRKSSNMLTYV